MKSEKNIGVFLVANPCYQVKVDCPVTLSISKFPISGKIYLFMRRTDVYERYPITGDGHPGYPYDPKGNS
jgi:hypothetical protein